ncbi:hypothetical protein D9Q98_003275 [Chlorella vulgaris]|uniref:Uncharacterized protein n=1 Tax=Chlorella vulgaris TaxID=3077 RepID=A0A9D4TSF8_CHLVU|nr:hypothetical protein D9Q98_003275 [Chlorella vulgaris]
MLILTSARVAAPSAGRVTRGCCRPLIVVPQAYGVPDYGAGLKKSSSKAEEAPKSNSAAQTRKWWDYRSPSASVGRQSSQIKLSAAIPQVSPDSGNGGSGKGGSTGGSGGGGGGGGKGGGGGAGGSGGGSDWMKNCTYVFSALLLAGGIAGYIRRGSTSSLMLSFAVAALLLISTSLMHHPSGTLLALGTTLGLAAVMGQRANKSRKVFPAGIISLLSALMSAGYARRLA